MNIPPGPLPRQEGNGMLSLSKNRGSMPMKKVLLHLAAVLSLIALGFTFME